MDQIVFLFARLYAENDLHNPEDRTRGNFHFHPHGAQTCYLEGLGSLSLWPSPLSNDSRTGDTGLSFFSRFLLMSPPTPPVAIPTAQPRGSKAKLESSNCNIHVYNNTEKEASKTGAREMLLPRLSLAGQPWKRTRSVK